MPIVAPPSFPGRRTSSPRRTGRGRRTLVALAAVVLVVAAGVTVDALRAPGSDPVSAKLAEWARDHGLGRLVSTAEAWRYRQDQPAVGGAPGGGIPQVGGERSGPALPPLSGGPALPGEGRWQTVVAAHGRPAVEVAFLRPDPQHTSYVTGIMRIDPTLVQGRLHPGTRDPGGQWPDATSLAGADAAGAVAAFNGGFRLTDPSHPGYYSDGRTVAPLVRGQASLVLYGDGHADVGAWGTDVAMTPTVVSVRQNLVPLVENGRVNRGCATGGEHEWGDTIGQAAFIDRSGFGVTATGEEVYAAGPALSVCTLGAVLADAGVVRGMELDINPSWVSGAYFTRSGSGAPVGHPLYPAERVSPSHYLTPSSRDWFSWSLR
jgi:hypothetical protein